MIAEGWIAVGVAGAVGATGLVLATRARAGAAIPVLRWRLVGPILPGSVINDVRVPPSLFEAQVRHLARRGFEAVTLAEACARRRDPAFLRRRPVVLTFDGPWAAFGGAAWPVLQQHGLARATLFFPPERLGEATFDLGEGRPEPLLAPEALAALALAGVEVGLQAGPVDVVDASVVERLREGRARLGDAVGREVTSLALPAGPDAKAWSRAARRAGFGAAVLVGGRGGLGRRTSPWAIPRAPVERDVSVLDLAMALHP